MAGNRKFKLNCLTVAVGQRVLRKEDGETYDEATFMGQADDLLKANKIVEVTKKKAGGSPSGSGSGGKSTASSE
jgi:hypothetical protein